MAISFQTASKSTPSRATLVTDGHRPPRPEARNSRDADVGPFTRKTPYRRAGRGSCHLGLIGGVAVHEAMTAPRMDIEADSFAVAFT